MNVQLIFFVTEISNKRTTDGACSGLSECGVRCQNGYCVVMLFLHFFLVGRGGTGGHLPLQNLFWYSHLHSCCNWTTRLLRPRISRLPEMPSLKCVEYYLDRDCIISCGIPRVQLVWRANNFCGSILVCTNVSPLFIFWV